MAITPTQGRAPRGALVFLVYIDTKTTQTIASHATSAFFITGTCLGFAPLRGTCAARRFFRRNHKNKEEKTKKATSTGRGRWSCGGLRRADLKVTAVFCGHGRWFILEVFFGFSIWRLKRHNPSFAFIAASAPECGVAGGGDGCHVASLRRLNDVAIDVASHLVTCSVAHRTLVFGSRSQRKDRVSRGATGLEAWVCRIKDK